MATHPTTPLPILWATFLPTHLLFIALTFFLPAEPITDISWLPVLALPALGLAGIAAEGSILARVAQQPQAWFLLRFVLSEVAAVVGFLAYFVSGTHVIQLICAGCGLLGHLLSFPTARALEFHAGLRRN